MFSMIFGIPRFSIAGALLLAIGLATGCHKNAPVSESNAATNAVPSVPLSVSSEALPSPRGPGPMPPAPASTVVVSDGGINATLEQLSLELRKYVVRTRSVPRNFEEFIAKSNVQAPAPPPGKKYAIENKAVVLVEK